MMPPDVISHENQLQHLSQPSIFILYVFRTADHAGQIFIPHRHLKTIRMHACEHILRLFQQIISFILNRCVNEKLDEHGACQVLIIIKAIAVDQVNYNRYKLKKTLPYEYLNKLTCPFWSRLLLVSFVLWKESDCFIQWAPEAGESGWM